MAYPIVYRRWPCGKKVWIPLMATELVLLVPLLVLFGVQQPDLFRTLFWRIGYENGFNSSPNIVIFAMVNATPLPTVPFVWSRTLTNFNVAISVVNLFILLVRMITIIMKCSWPIINLFVNTGLVAIWTASLYGQLGPDYADPEHPSPVPWYISKGCEFAKPYRATSSCQMARGTVAVTVLMLVVMLVYFGISVWAMLPRKDAAIVEDDEDEDMYASDTKQTTVEMHTRRNVTPSTPSHASHTLFTPRTQAFHTLDRRLPLRQE